MFDNVHIEVVLLKKTIGCIMRFVVGLDIHCEPKPNQLKLLGKLVIQHGIKASFDGRSSV